MLKLRKVLYACVLTITFTVLMAVLFHDYLNARSRYNDLNTCRPAGLSECLCPGADLRDTTYLCTNSDEALAKVQKYRNYMIAGSGTYILLLGALFMSTQTLKKRKN